MNGYDGPVREYLAYCRRAAAELKLQGSVLEPKYHPTEAGCLRLVFHRTPAEAQEIRQAYREATAPPVPRLTQDRDNSKQRGGATPWPMS